MYNMAEQQLNHTIDFINDVMDAYSTALYGEVDNALSLTNEVVRIYGEYLDTAPYHINILAELNLHEPQVSSLLCAFLDQHRNGKHEVLVSFISCFLPSFPIELIDKPELSCEYRHIDICIQEIGKYAIIIENKSCGADFMYRQISRYIDKLKDEGYNESHIYVVIIPPNKDYPTDVQCIWNKEKVLCEKCENILNGKCDVANSYRESFDSRYVDVPLYPSLYQWLDGIEVRQDEPSVYTTKFLLEDYIRNEQLNTYNKEHSMEIEDIIKEKLGLGNSPIEDYETLRKKLIEVNQVRNGINNLIADMFVESIPDLQKKMQAEIDSDYVVETRNIGDNQTIGVNINFGKSRVYIHIGSDGSQYVGVAPSFGCKKLDNLKPTVLSKFKSVCINVRTNADLWYCYSYCNLDEDLIASFKDVLKAFE